MRLLAINNMPSFYRTPLYKAIGAEWASRTGGDFRVAFQVRRDPQNRDEWFFSDDGDLDFQHTFQSERTRNSSIRTGYPLRFGVSEFTSFKPTHVFTAGWDCPLSLTANLHAMMGKSGLTMWVESNATTSRDSGWLAMRARKALTAGATSFVVPTSSSKAYVEKIRGQRVPSMTLLNPVDVERLPETSETGRAVFIGDLSIRKGFDRFIELANSLDNLGWSSIAWGRDSENHGQRKSGVTLMGSQHLHEIAPQLRSNDVLVLASRQDPAPLIYSEAIAFGLRMVVSNEIAYSDRSTAIDGVMTADFSNPKSALAAFLAVANQSRPAESAADELRPSEWARSAVELFLDPKTGDQ